MKVTILTMKFTDIQLQPQDIPKLRGWFSHQFPEHTQLHNHLPDNTFSYKYPVIQYRMIDNHPALMAMNEGIHILKDIFFRTNEIRINQTIYPAHDREVFLGEYDFGATSTYQKYSFLSPWMALKEENHKTYISLDTIERQKFLRHILRENLKTISKGFVYQIPDIEQIKVDGFFEETQMNFKNQKMLGFKGKFVMNFDLPDFVGLGKQSARGFGVVMKES